jgi:erythrin-vacuolar iron transport family protein
MPKNFKDLSEADILALAISNEETDGRVYADLAARLRDNYPTTAKIFKEMEAEEDNHRRRLIDEFRRRFGDHIPLIRREDVKGFISRKPVWLIQSLGIETVRRYAESMEAETQRFYERAAARVSDASTRKLLGDLAEAERGHVVLADELQREHLTTTAKEEEDKAQRRLFVLQIVQPGLSGLMDGSVSTLAPVFAAAFATQSSHAAFLVGLAASLGAGISMGFAEAVSDDGSLTGRGKPLLRGIVCGLMTTAGGIGHSLPYLIPNFRTATALAIGVVAIELAVISWIRKRYMDTPFLRAALQVIVGGVCVFVVGILIGSS